MKIKPISILLFFILAIVGLNTFAQKKQDILFKIDGRPILISDFEKNYTKNIDIVVDSNQKKIDNYLNLYINYKLKVLEAQALGLDTLVSFKGELSRYKQQLMRPYLKDSAVLEKLVKEAYKRTKYEVNVSHILIRVDVYATPKDTLEAFKKIEKARHAILNGQSFDQVAKQYSEDPSVKQNAGNIGYFKAFQMVYPFENKAYSLKIDSLSYPFRTRYGYHILKVNNKRLSKGEVEVAHIMLKNTDSSSVADNKLKIDSLYHKLKKGLKFSDLAKKYSQDLSSARKGGLLPKFSTGKMIQSFSDKAFDLDSIDSFTEPFKTRFGWYIVKLIKRFPIPEYGELKSELLKNVKRGERALEIEKAIVDRLKITYNITDYKTAIADFYDKNWHLKADSLQRPILKVQDSIFTQKDFVVYLKFKGLTKSIPYSVYKQFKERKIIEYYKAKLEITNPNYAASVKEFKEGLLLFDVMQKMVWNKAKKDSMGLKAYHILNRSKYPKDFKKHKGEVMNDYQNYLEKEWIATLRKEYQLEINKRALKRLKKKYK